MDNELPAEGAADRYLYLVRHAEATPDERGLTDAGRRQAALLVKGGCAAVRCRWCTTGRRALGRRDGADHRGAARPGRSGAGGRGGG